MAEVFYTDSPTTEDTVVFDLNTGDEDVYEIGQVIIYHIARSRGGTNDKVLDTDLLAFPNTNTFNEAVPVAIFGDDDVPAYLVIDPDASFLQKVDTDPFGTPLTGIYRLIWQPQLAREGDYLVCYRWRVLPGGDEEALAIPFILASDTAARAVVPSHRTPTGKYRTLLDLYTPQMYKTPISPDDLTPEIIDGMNDVFARSFTDAEDLGNQIIDLIDANVTSDTLLPYLANLFHIKLRGADITRWRRQIKTAIEGFKRKGTLKGLREALDKAGITLTRFAQLWQVVSQSLKTDGFLVTEDNLDPATFTLSEVAILPIDPANFEVAVRLEGTLTYSTLSSDHVSLSTTDGVTTATWTGDNLSIGALTLQAGDHVRILYKVAPVTDQSLEDYIRTLPLMDQRDEALQEYPIKNWNVKVIEEDDPSFAALCPVKHPIAPPVIFGKVRTEFPYSENAYNMEAYNGLLRDSTAPCDIDRDFQEPCGCCLSSKFTIDVEVSGLSAERVQEVSDIVNEYKPFHAVPHMIGYSGGVDDFVVPPVEDVEILFQIQVTDTTGQSQMEFNRLLETSNDQSGELNRSELATPTVLSSTSGNLSNNYVGFFAPGVPFNSLPLATNNLLELLGGTSAGDYTVTRMGDSVLMVNQGTPDSTASPIDQSEAAYQLSSVLYSEAAASIYQESTITFTAPDVVSGPEAGWTVNIASGPYTGVYTVSDVDSEGGLILASFPAAATGLNYTVRTPLNVVVFSGLDGEVTVQQYGRVEIDLVAEELGFRAADYLLYSGTQYTIIGVQDRPPSPTVDSVLIDGYSGGTVVGSANVTVLRRLAAGTGFLGYVGLMMTGATPPVDGTIENSTSLNDFRIFTNGNYYQIASIAGSDMELVGPPLDVGLSGSVESYDIVQFVKTSPITTQTGVPFDRLDRRGNDTILVQQETAAPMWLSMFDLGGEMTGGNESITVTVEYRD